MTPELKQQWLDALESGDYKQSTGYLQSARGFCCLGVLADIIDPDGWAPVLPGFSGFMNIQNWCGMSGGLSNKVLADISLLAWSQDELIRINDSSTDFGPSIKYIKEKV